MNGKPLNGKAFFTQLETACPGFLERFYRCLFDRYSDGADKTIAVNLAPFAAAWGCTRLTGEMVGKERQRLGLTSRKTAPMEREVKPAAPALIRVQNRADMVVGSAPQPILPLQPDLKAAMESAFRGLHKHLREVEERQERRLDSLASRIESIERDREGSPLTALPVEGVLRAS